MSEIVLATCYSEALSPCSQAGDLIETTLWSHSVFTYPLCGEQACQIGSVKDGKSHRYIARVWLKFEIVVLCTRLNDRGFV